LLIVGQSMIFGLAISLEETTPSSIKWAVQVSILAGTLVVLGLLGGTLFQSAGRELRSGRITLDAMFLLTLCGALAASVQSMLSGTGPVYFEVVSILLVVYTVGKELTARTRAQAIHSLQLNIHQSKYVNLWIDDQERVVPLESLKIGDQIVIRPGESIPIDAQIVQGEGFIGEAPFTGETLPRLRRVGDSVLAGSLSYDARFVVEATAEPGASRLDAIQQLLHEVHSRPSAVQSFADRLGQGLLPLVLLVAGGTFLYWSSERDLGTGWFRAMSVLLVACPCAIGLATPLVLWSTVSRLAERGLVLHSTETLEKLARVTRVCLDKTGTLSEEQAEIRSLEWQVDWDREKLLGILKRIELQSNHPLARAFAEVEAPLIQLEFRTWRLLPGIGLEGEVIHEQQVHRFRVGRLDDSSSRIAFEWDDQLILKAELSERIRDSARPAIEELKQHELTTVLLTGDVTRREIAQACDEVHLGLLPDQKAQLIEAWQKEGARCLMVGDGTNDAAALAQAEVGIALASGTELAHRAAGGTLYHRDLRLIPWAILMAREAMGRIRSNLRRSLAYNFVGMTLAATGLLHPVVAALLMVVSSLGVIFTSLRVGGTQTCLPLLKHESPWGIAIVHALSITFQGILIAMMLQLRTPWLPLFFLLLGSGLSWLWLRWRTQPHGFDMVVGMLSLGNLGMLLGWWADLKFQPLTLSDCCACEELARGQFTKLWMWLGMLLFGSLALFLPRTSGNGHRHSRGVMLTAGNLGMLIGMFLGSLLAAEMELTQRTLKFALHFGLMTLGMIVGMFVFSELTQYLRTAIIAKRIRFSRTDSVPKRREHDAERTDAARS
jgi:heavy metal translocating P-type ATPase